MSLVEVHFKDGSFCGLYTFPVPTTWSPLTRADDLKDVSLRDVNTGIKFPAQDFVIRHNSYTLHGYAVPRPTGLHERALPCDAYIRVDFYEASEELHYCLYSEETHVLMDEWRYKIVPTAEEFKEDD